MSKKKIFKTLEDRLDETIQSLEEENKKYKEEIEQSNKMLDVLLKIIDIEDLGIKYADLIAHAYNMDSFVVNDYIKTQVKARNAREKLYKAEIADIAEESFSDCKEVTELLDKLLDYMTDIFTYEINSRDMYDFLGDFTGKCWHFSHFAVDILNYFGYKAEIVKDRLGPNKNDQHVWIRVFHPDVDCWFHHDLTWAMQANEKGENGSEFMYMTEDESYAKHVNVY